MINLMDNEKIATSANVKRQGAIKLAEMDRDLAGAIIGRWGQGLPVSEVSLYKAASALGIDPMAALIEARFYTYLDNYLLEKRAMSKAERIVFSAAAGLSHNSMEKSASSYGLSADELIIEALRERDFVPDVEKIATLTSIMSQAQQTQGKPKGNPDIAASLIPGDQAPSMVAPQDPIQEQAGQVMMAPPAEETMLQQQPEARFKPSPMAPEQMPPSPEGNLEALIGQGQEAFGEQATQNGGVAPAGAQEPAPAPMSPEQRIQQVGPNLDEETVARYAEQLVRFEEGFGMQINDPKQMVKFVKELQKVDGKRIDQGIKAMGQQLEQEQAQELGVDSTPTIDGSGGAQVLPPKQPNPQGQESATGQSPAQQQANPPSQGQPPQQGVAQKPSPPKQENKPNPNEQSVQAAVEKVAHAARVLARASFNR